MRRLTAAQRAHLIWPVAAESGQSAAAAFIVQATVIDLDPKRLGAHRRKYVRQWRESRAAERAVLSE